MVFRRYVEANRRRVVSAIVATVVMIVVLGYIGALTLLSYNPTSGDTEVLGVSFKLPVFPKTGSHKVMVFSEMHYQRSFRVQDVPRIMPQSDSVSFVAMGSPDAVTHAEMIRVELRYDTLDEYRELTIPDRVSREYDAGRAAEVFRVNCAMCHGITMTGDGTVAALMRERKKGPLPADLMAPLTQDSPPGELFAFISWGGRQGSAAVFRGLETRSPMPPFQWLLSEDDRWALVRYLRSR